MNKKTDLVFPIDVEGWLSKEEGELLFDLAQQNTRLGEVVELGSYHGRSTICLAQGSKRKKGGAVYAIDNFTGDIHMRRSIDFYDIFCKNIEKYHLAEFISPVRGEFEDIAKGWKKKIRLLFIDGSHLYENVKRDILCFEKYVVDGGIIAFHDSLIWEGVYRVVLEMIRSGFYDNVATLNTHAGITYMQKLMHQDVPLSPHKITILEKKFVASGKRNTLIRTWTAFKGKISAYIPKTTLSSADRDT